MVKNQRFKPWTGWLWTDGWVGRTQQVVTVVGETATRLRIEPPGDDPVRLAGRSRWIYPGDTALVPKTAVCSIRYGRRVVARMRQDP